MIIKNSELIQTAVTKKQYPKHDMPEIALAGRSNVGKSSLINCITNRRKLARTSGKPGKTRVINFYKANNDLVLVDLPGYGYASAPKREIESWKRIIEEYLFNRDSLKAIILLLDIRHMPNENDIIMYDFILKMDKIPIVVFTKADKLTKTKARNQVNIICERLRLNKENTVIFSALKKTGKDELVNMMYSVLGLNTEKKLS